MLMHEKKRVIYFVNTTLFIMSLSMVWQNSADHDQTLHSRDLRRLFWQRSLT